MITETLDMLSSTNWAHVSRAKLLAKAILADPKAKAHHAEADLTLAGLVAVTDKAEADMVAQETGRLRVASGDRTRTAGGRPPVAYIVSVESDDYLVWGVRAAVLSVEALARTAKANWVVAVGSVTNAISKNGSWFKVLATDQGDKSVVIRRANAREEAEWKAAAIEGAENGTDPA